MEGAERRNPGNDDEETGGKYWISDSYHEGLPKNYFSKVNSFTISIVLDFEARYQFSAIRLLILCKQSEDPGRLTIVKCKDPNHCGTFAPDGHKRHYRSRLTTQSKESENSQLCLALVCTVAFELQHVDDGTLKIVQTSVEQSLDGIGTPLRRVVYEYVQPTNPIEPVLLVFLSVNRPLQNILIPYMNRVPTHSVRIVPVPTKRRGSHIDLPPKIIRRVVRLSVCTKHKGWQPALLNYSLVCKAWEHVLELFFSNFNSDGHHPVDARHVLRTLRWRPQYGASMHCHDYRDYLRDGHIVVGGVSGGDAFYEILKHATHIRRLRLPSTPLQLVDGAMSILHNLRGVRELMVRQAYKSEHGRSLLNIADIQMAIASWPLLKDLRILGFGETRDRDSQYKLPDHLQCAPREMSLKGGSLSPGQLLRFVSPTNCKLAHLIFEDITGPSNAEFRSFLSMAAPTLITMRLYLCHFTCPPGEELALDAVMPQMKSLEHLITNNSTAGISSITRKLPPSEGSIQSPGYISFLSASSGMTIQDVEQAMHITGWRSISISWRDVPAWDPLLIARAEDAARHRGIRIILRQSWTSPTTNLESD